MMAQGDPDAQAQSQSSTRGGSPFESFGRRIDAHLRSAAPRVEEEMRKVIGFLNDEVVPQVRRQSSTALRTAADELNRLAQYLDQRRSAASPTAPGKDAA